eukprot:TRINITY_DN61819_c0_g1_i1.p1 TRINITY_DN61819_c0_g1~~TRINITY_DN61819_c0_g1_i1.p1  ORF type:complete len:724 (-),score=98.99 TRINITY_DN61819_c0_g1_i1:63-2234(-)
MTAEDVRTEASPASPGAGVVPVTPPAAAAHAGALDAKEVASDDGTLVPLRPIQCIAGGKRPQESDFDHCPHPQSFVRCSAHGRAELANVLSKEDMNKLHDIWTRYRDDLTWSWYDKRPQFTDEDCEALFSVAQKVVEAMVETFSEPMVLDQATISNTNHIGHPPHADNLQFDSVWWKGKRIRAEHEVIAAQEGAYVLWRTEKTSYRSFSCSVALSDPESYEGGEIRFFEKFGDKQPVARYKCSPGCGVAFCGCQRNIHMVTGVKSGFRLVFLVWTRPHGVKVPENSRQTCYFRPGTGQSVWLTTADLMSYKARKRRRQGLPPLVWMPTEEDGTTCLCEKCVAERHKVSWAECCRKSFEPAKVRSQPTTPTTSAGDSPRNQCIGDNQDSVKPHGSGGSDEQESAEVVAQKLHCPHPRGFTRCKYHGQMDLKGVLSAWDIDQLKWIWDNLQDDLSHPWYKTKPEFSDEEFDLFKMIAEQVVTAMSQQLGEPLVLDQATISCTNHLGHPPHADNLQFDSVWYHGKQIKQRDEVEAARGGAYVYWREAKTSFRNYSASVALSDPSGYKGGDLEFYDSWGSNHTVSRCKNKVGDGVLFCGCDKSIHAVTGVRWGFRLVLLVWTRPPNVEVPEDQRTVCYFRPGTGLSVWLTTADLLRYPTKKPSTRRRNSKWKSWQRAWSRSNWQVENRNDHDWEEAEETSEQNDADGAGNEGTIDDGGIVAWNGRTP